MALRLASVNPLLLLAVSVFGFGGWVADEALTPPASAPVVEGAPEEPRFGACHERLLHGVHPGMPRSLVEGRLAPLGEVEMLPVDTSAGSPVFHNRYRVYLSHPVPELDPSRPPHRFRPGRYDLVLEFDGLLPGHPLVRATLTPLGAP